jgi:hypothetical protein
MYQQTNRRSVNDFANGDIIPTAGIERLQSALSACLTIADYPYPTVVRQSLMNRHVHIAETINREQLSVSLIGFAPAFNGIQMYPGQPNDWALMNLGDDPLFHANRGRLVAPRQVRDHLRHISKSGLDFDTLYIAHEVPAGIVQPGKAISLEAFYPPEPSDLKRRANWLTGASDSLWSFVSKVPIHAFSETRSVSKAIGAAANLKLTSAMSAIHSTMEAATTAALDPILLGVNLDWGRSVNGIPMGMWYYLTHWCWS